MLGGRRHAGLAHALHCGDRQACDHLCIAVECAVADDLAYAVVEVDTGRKAQVDAHGAQFRREQPAALRGEPPAGLRVRIVEPPDQARGRQLREAGAEALYPPAFLVDGDEQRRRAHRADVAHQLLELLHAGVVAREKNHGADQWMTQHLAVLGRERRARNVDHDRPKGHFVTCLTNTAMLSTCVVCGNISITPADTSEKPCSRTRMPASRARLPA